MLDTLVEVLDDSAGDALVRRLDGKPLPVSRHSVDPQATSGRGAGGLAKGYKLHAIYGKSNRPLAMRVTGLGVDERTVATELIAELPCSGYVLADGFYDANRLHELAVECGQKLITPRRFRGCGPVRRGASRCVAGATAAIALT